MQVAILGIGLIGGSLALGLKKRTDCHVLGYDILAESVDYAKAHGVVDDGSTDLAAVVTEADVIILAPPVNVIKQLIDQLVQLPLKNGCIVSDVGSTKREIMEAATALQQQGVTFIGGHPMAGSHRSGVQVADVMLFANKKYVLTIPEQVDEKAVATLSQLLAKATQAEILTFDAATHDRVVGAISHLPQMLATSLAAQVGDYQADKDWFYQLAASGYRDVTRIAASDPLMWRDILLSNRTEVLVLLDDCLTQIQQLQMAIQARNGEEIEAIFRKAKQAREQLSNQ